MAAVAAAAPAAAIDGTVVPGTAAGEVLQQSATNAARAREAYETLTATEADTLEAIVARLIPTDANGPGAIEARAAHYIDRALGGALASRARRTRPGSRRSIAIAG